MTLRVRYEQRFDKNDKEYWVKISVRTDKVIRKVSNPEKVKIFKRRGQSQVRRLFRKEVESELAYQGWGGTYAQYMRERKRLEKKIKKDRDIRGIKKSQKQIKNQAKAAAYKTIGYKVSYRFYFKYWSKECEYAEVWQGVGNSQYRDGDPYKIFEEFQGTVMQVFLDIIEQYPLYNTPRRGTQDDGVNGGHVIMVDRKGNLEKEWDIPQKEINVNTITCINGKAKKKSKYKGKKDGFLSNNKKKTKPKTKKSKR